MICRLFVGAEFVSGRVAVVMRRRKVFEQGEESKYSRTLGQSANKMLLTFKNFNLLVCQLVAES